MAGLLHMDANGAITVLATELDGEPLRFVDDLDVDSDGGIWFSDASQRFDYTQVALDFLKVAAPADCSATTRQRNRPRS